MEFFEITEELKASPGEYIYHTPTKQVVLCGSFNRSKNQVRVLSHGKLFVDKISNFQKIKLNGQERRSKQASRCKGCGR